MKYSFSLTDKLKQGGVNSSEMRMGQAILMSPSFNSDSLIQNVSPGFGNPKRHVHTKIPWHPLSLRDFPCSWFKEQNTGGLASSLARLPGPRWKQLLSTFLLTPCQECLLKSPQVWNSGVLFFHLKVHRAMDSSRFLLEELGAQWTSNMILGSGVGGTWSRNSAPNTQMLAPDPALLCL